MAPTQTLTSSPTTLKQTLEGIYQSFESETRNFQLFVHMFEYMEKLNDPLLKDKILEYQKATKKGLLDVLKGKIFSTKEEYIQNELEHDLDTIFNTVDVVLPYLVLNSISGIWMLQQNQIKVIQTIDRQYLPSDNTILFSVESSMANQYIIDLSKNVKRGVITKLEKGGWANMAPIGYLNDGKGGILLDKERAKYIKKIFTLYAEGNKSVKEIADQLFSEGFRSRGGNKYHKSKIHKILNDSFYCGIMVKDGKQYLGKHEPIITKQLFDKVQDVLNKKAHTKKQKIYFAFRGLLKCDSCGCVLTATKKKGRHTYYYCTNGKGKCDEHKLYLKEQKVAQELTKAFDEVVVDERLIEMCYKANKEKLGETDTYLTQATQSLETSLAKAGSRKSKLVDLLLDNTLSKDVYEQKLIEIDNEIVKLKKDLEELQQKKTSNNEITLERIKSVFLYPIKAKKLFEAAKNTKQEKLIKSLLWNAAMRNKKIAHLSFKEPFDVLFKIQDKSDFLSVRRGRDSNPR